MSEVSIKFYVEILFPHIHAYSTPSSKSWWAIYIWKERFYWSI